MKSSNRKMRLRIALISLIIVYGLSTLNSLNKLMSSTPTAPQERLEALFDVKRHRGISESTRETLNHDAPHNRSKALLSDSMPGKPYIILHLGPAKTGTSTLQNEMTAWKDQVLELDNVLYGGAYYALDKHLGRLDIQGNFMDVNFKCNGAMAKARVEWEASGHNNNRTLKEHLLSTVPCVNKILSGLQPYHSNGTSLIFSNEILSKESEWRRVPGYNQKVAFDWLSIAAVFGDIWNFILLVGHRPYLDWVPSAKAQVDKYTRSKPWINAWPGIGGRKFESLFPEYTLESSNETLTTTNRLISKEDLAKHWSYGVNPFMHSSRIVMYSSPYIPIRILHLHDPVPIRTNFLCNIMPNTPRSCQASREADERGKSEFAHMNVGKEKADRIWYDQLLTTAVEKGMLNTSISEGRPQMVDMIRNNHEVLLNRTLHDFPQKCPHQEALRYLWDYSWQIEQMMLGDNANMTLHEELFQRNILSAKYCTIDALGTLRQSEWKQFFSEGWRKIRTKAINND